MKTLLLFLLLAPSIVFAQDTTTVEQYCEITIAPKLFSKKVTLAIDYGDLPLSGFSDYRLRDNRDELLSFNTRVDALNYMARQGWELVHALSMPNDAVSSMYLLKKRLPKTRHR
jgi:hypothetical protein